MLYHAIAQKKTASRAPPVPFSPTASELLLIGALEAFAPPATGPRAPRAVRAALPAPARLLLLERRRWRRAADGGATHEQGRCVNLAAHVLRRAGQARRKANRWEEAR